MDKQQRAFAGNIELRDLKFKDSLLDDLNYPIRTAFGYLGKRTKIEFDSLFRLA